MEHTFKYMKKQTRHSSGKLIVDIRHLVPLLVKHCFSMCQILYGLWVHIIIFHLEVELCRAMIFVDLSRHLSLVSDSFFRK